MQGCLAGHLRCRALPLLTCLRARVANTVVSPHQAPLPPIHAGVIGTAAYAAPELLNPETPGSAAAGRQVTPAEEARILKADVSWWLQAQGLGSLPAGRGTVLWSRCRALYPTPQRAPFPTPSELFVLSPQQVYSFGVTLFEIMERRRPFAGMDGFQIQTQVGGFCRVFGMEAVCSWT